MVDPRDVARIRTEARLVELALRGLLDEALLDPNDKPPAAVVTALRTAHEFAERCQVALSAAIDGLPGGRA